MLIIYNCTNCDGKRFLTAVSKDVVLCKKCNARMSVQQGNISSDSQTTEEARYMADEALYNTVGDRINDKHRVRHL